MRARKLREGCRTEITTIKQTYLLRYQEHQGSKKETRKSKNEKATKQSKKEKETAKNKKEDTDKDTKRGNWEKRK